jgi:hypothetical protein
MPISHSIGILEIYLFVLLFSPCADSLSLDRLIRLKTAPLKKSDEYIWPLYLLRFLFTWIFFSAGIYKLRTEGFSWVSNDHITPFIRAKDRFDVLQQGDFLSQHLRFFFLNHAFAGRFASAIALFLEVTSPVALWKPARPFILGGLALMQICIYLLFRINFSPFIIGYLAFIDLGPLYFEVRKRVTS